MESPGTDIDLEIGNLESRLIGPFGLFGRIGVWFFFASRYITLLTFRTSMLQSARPKKKKVDPEI